MSNNIQQNITNIKKPVVATPDTEEKLKSKMQEISFKEKERIVESSSMSEGVPYINLIGFPIRPDALRYVPEESAKQLKIIPFFLREGDIRIGAVFPKNQEVLDVITEVEKTHKLKASLYSISQHSFDRAVAFYDILPKIRKDIGGVKITPEDFEKFEKEINSFKDLDKMIDDVSMTDMVTLIIAASVKSKASDIHIEAEENSIKVRYRIDGMLLDVASIKKDVWQKVIARIKLLSKLKINITTKPQDGRFTIFLKEEKIDVRVSCLPTSYGESVVMRLLMSSAIGIEFESIGLSGKAFEQLKIEIAKPNGMIITTGPTGSGKTTTLYAILNKLNDAKTKIITIEDPVEYRLEGVNQSQIDASKGYTFANGLRSILRQDPDVIMVGEIRDLETADIAINSALTGHVVLTTLHTNDAFGTVPRFLAMNVKPFLLAPALNAMVGQRLARKVCQHCKKNAVLKSDQKKKVLKILQHLPKDSAQNIDLNKLQFFIGEGCDKCQGIGYKGRIGIFEVMTMNKEIEDLILSGHVSEYDMLKVAVKNGTITMIQDGLLKALAGITSVDEVFRVANDTSGIYGE